MPLRGHRITGVCGTSHAAHHHPPALATPSDPEDYTDWAMIRLNRAACLAAEGDPDAGLAHATETLIAVDGPMRQGIITSRARAQRASRAGREFRSLIEDTTGMREIPA